MPLRKAIRRGALAGFVLHSLSIGWLWLNWDVTLRRTVLVWLDIPASLLYLSFASRGLLAAALLVGGLQWAVLGGLLSYLLGRASLAARQ